jgi:hypothetical protein
MAEQTIEERREIEAKARQLHFSVDLMGLRAHATGVGLLQLCAELLKAKVIDDDAIGRIKEAIATDIIVSRKISRGKDEFARSLRQRLDATFPKTGREQTTELGPIENMPAELAEPDA